MPHEILLFTLVVECEGRSYTTQAEGASPVDVFREYLERIYPVTAAEGFGPNAPRLSPADLIYVVPMEGLMNAWALSAGREGRYVSGVCLQTVRGHAA